MGKAFALGREEMVSTLITREGYTTANGAAGGTTLIDAALIGATVDNINEKTVLIMEGPAAGQDRPVTNFAPLTGTITVPAFTDTAGAPVQITAGTSYRIINISSVELDILNVLTLIGTNTDLAGTTTLFAWLAQIYAPVGISSGLFYSGTVTAVPGANQFTVPTLIGLGQGKFADVTAPYRAFILKDAGGASAAPQGEQQSITAYTSVTGVFTTNAFTAAVGIGDEILIIHPRLAEIATILADMNVPGADAATNTLMRDVIGNKTDTNAGTSLLARLLVQAADNAANTNVRDVMGNKSDTELTGATTNTASLPRYIKRQHNATNRVLLSMDFWSATQALVSLTDVAAPGTDVALPNVVVAGLPAGATIVRATAFFKFRVIENSNVAANKLQGDQNIQVQKGGAGGYATGIALVDDLLGIGAGPLREGGDVLMGNTNLAAKVTANDTYNFQWTASLVDVANLNFCDVQTGLRIWYSV